VAGRPSLDAAPLGGLAGFEHQRPRPYVGIAHEVVGVGVVGVVLGDPPAVAQAAQQVPVDQAQDPAASGAPGDLQMADVVTEEFHLRGDDAQNGA